VSGAAVPLSTVRQSGYIKLFRLCNRKNAGSSVPSRHTPWPPRMPHTVPIRSGRASQVRWPSRLPCGHPMRRRHSAWPD